MTVTHTGIKNAIELNFCRKSRTCKGAENGESSQSFFSYVLPVRFVQSSAALTEPRNKSGSARAQRRCHRLRSGLIE